jgi:phenylacetate-coenzyme A ligase PaaK-like adenylate-forming protein
MVHSGGWKKLEAAKVQREEVDELLLRDLSPASAVIDYYGLVEQVGVVYPLCSEGWRHVPVWADVLVRDPLTLECQASEPGQLQLINLLAHGAPYHSVLTEDVGRLIPGECACGRGSRRFELIGRLPKAEVRGCANV